MVPLVDQASNAGTGGARPLQGDSWDSQVLTDVEAVHGSSETQT